MMRVLLITCLSVLAATFFAAKHAYAIVYGADITSGQTYSAESTESNGASGRTPDKAFNDAWPAQIDSWYGGSGCIGGAADGNCWLKIQFSSAKAIRRIKIYQGDDTSTALRYVTSVLFQYSDDNSSWTTAATHSSLTTKTWHTLDNGDVGRHVYWRLLANSGVQIGDSWIINEVEMMEAEPQVSSGAVMLMGMSF